MTKKLKSRKHHWWPVGLQKYWTDRNGDVWWIEPDGKIDKKRAKNRNIAHKSHGHTVFRGNVWETNFEGEFQSADDSAPNVVNTLLGLKPLGRTHQEFFSMMRLLFKRDRNLRDLCKFYHLDEITHRELLLLLFSLLIRSPANRSKYEDYPKIFGLPSDEGVGKANMSQSYHLAKKLCEEAPISNQYFVLIHSPFKTFIFGDGSLDWLTGSLVAIRIDGRALIPLTPHLCIYFCTPNLMRSTPNCASLNAAYWIVDRINDIVQIYSRDKLFFLGKPPVTTDAFRQRQFLEHRRKTDELIEMLDNITSMGSDKTNSLGGNYFL